MVGNVLSVQKNISKLVGSQLQITRSCYNGLPMRELDPELTIARTGEDSEEFGCGKSLSTSSRQTMFL